MVETKVGQSEFVLAAQLAAYMDELTAGPMDLLTVASWDYYMAALSVDCGMNCQV